MLRSLPWFDLPMACLGALVSGSLVGWINFEHGILPALTAALKQAGYAFVATGLIIQFCRWLNRRQVSRLLAIGMAIILPLLLTMALLYVLHSLKGTPEPLPSIIPGTVLTLIGLLLVSWRTWTAAPAEGAGRTLRPDGRADDVRTSPAAGHRLGRAALSRNAGSMGSPRASGNGIDDVD
jgi:hypothetical protein